MWQPGESHDLLLRASLLEGEAFHRAFQGWSERLDVDRVDGPSQRMFPQLFVNASRHGVKSPLMETLKRHQLQTWIRNERLLRHSEAALSSLSDAGIDWLLLKGAGVVPLVYDDWSRRPMNDLDVLVHSRDVTRARRALQRAGWHSVYPTERRTEDVLCVVHSCAFRNAEGLELDLHAHALIQCCDDRFDAELWTLSQPVELPWGTGHTPCATDHLLLAAAHGRASELFNRVVSLQWAADAMLILARGPVDFDRLLRLAHQWRLTQPLAHSLRYLAARLDAPIPAAVIAELERAGASPVERLEAMCDRISSPNLQRIGTFTAQYVRTRAGRSGSGVLDGLGTYLRHAWSLDSSWQIAPTLALKVAKNAVRIGRYYAPRPRMLRQAALLPARLARTGRGPSSPGNASEIEQRIAASVPRLERVLLQNVAPFWRTRARDDTLGGYHLNHDGVGRDLGPAPRHIIGQTGTLWFFSRLCGSPWGTDADAQAARHGYAWLRDAMWDGVHGGFFWEVHPDGRPVTTHKHGLSACSAIYALVTFASVFDDAEALELAERAFALQDAHMHDGIHGGYHAMRRRDWSDASGVEGFRHGDPDRKRCDLHLHILEACTALHRARPRPELGTRMDELLERITRADAAQPEGMTLFAADWTPLPKVRAEYGFDVKRIWVTEDAAGALDRTDPRMDALHRHLLQQVVTCGWDRRDGGLFEAGPPGRRANELYKSWWTQAELLVASLKRWCRSREARDGALYLATLDWIHDHQVDWDHGEWHEIIDRHGCSRGRKAWAWKSPLHSARAMFECLELAGRMRAGL